MITNYVSYSKISQLKKDLEDGNIDSSVAYLEHAVHTGQLAIFKIHKLLLIPLRPDKLFSAFLSAIERIIPDSLSEEKNYIQFLKAYLEAVKRYEHTLCELLDPYFNRQIKDFMFLVLTPIGENFEMIFADFHEWFIKGGADKNSSESLIEFHASAHNVLRGTLVDALFAITRLLNFFAYHKAAVASPLIINTYSPKDKAQFLKALDIAGRMNSFLYALDRVCYDECYISQVEQHGEQFVFTLEVKDFDFEKARDIGLKNMLSQKMMGRKQQRWLAKKLETFGLEALELAWEFYQNQLGIFVSGYEKWYSAKKDFLKQLEQLDAEDELLIAFGDESNEIVSHYCSMLAMIAFVSAASSLCGKITTSYNLTNPRIPEHIIENLLSRTSIGMATLTSKINEYVQTLPTQQHMDIFRKPFVRDQEKNIYAVSMISSENWPSNIRSNLIQNGETGNRIGRIWEAYIANTLRETDWEKVIENFKITRDKKILTDIDIVAKRKDLLLLIQVKIHYGTNVHTFEQWKFKQKIIQGVIQVKKSEHNIIKDMTILKHHFNAQELAEVKTIKSIVMTNSHIFNGWKYEQVPVVSFSSLMQLINGAHVKFQTQQGDVLETKNYAATRVLTTKEMLDFIDIPLDWRIGNLEYEVIYHTEEFEKYTMRFPIVDSHRVNMFRD